MWGKISFIDEYFKEWDKDLARAAELLSNQRYHLEGMLVLSCYLGAFAAMRFPTLGDGGAYVQVVLDYSGKCDFFQQIDLLFFYQWPRSQFRDRECYKALKQHADIIDALMLVYGSEDDVKAGTRFVSQAEFIAKVKAAGIPGFDEQNLREQLPLFSLAQLLYRCFRCNAVHNAKFPFVSKLSDINGNVTYEENHPITGDVLLEATRAVHQNLWEECRTKGKWPRELDPQDRKPTRAKRTCRKQRLRL